MNNKEELIVEVLAWISVITLATSLMYFMIK
jgi:hypothetical protein